MPLNCRRIRNPLFAKRWFSDDVILMGVAVALAQSCAGLVRYSPCFAECSRHLEKPVGRCCRRDETYIKVGGRSVYLYRAFDERGPTVIAISAVRGALRRQRHSSARH
jgi:hypothetical protein